MRRVLVILLVPSLMCIASAFGSGPTFLDRPVEAWLTDLSDSSPEARRGAAFALGKMGAEDSDPREVVDALTHSLDDKDAAVRDFAASGLGDLLLARNGQTEPFWSKTGPILQVKLKDDDNPRVRRSAAFALGAFGPAAALARDDLIVASKDAAPIVRQNAAWALGKLGTKAGADGVEQLRLLLHDDDSSVRRDALHALGEIGNPTAHAAVADMLETAEKERGVVRKAAVEALMKLVGKEDRRSAAGLYPLLRDQDSETCLDAAYILAAIGGSAAVEALPVLRAALNDADPRVQELAAINIGYIGKEAAPAVEDLGRVLVEAKEPKVRLNAALSLAAIGPASRKALPQLIQALQYHDSEPESDYNSIRPYVAEALNKIDFPGLTDAIPALLHVVKEDQDPQTRIHAIYALSKIWDLDKYKVTPVLAGVLEETSPETALVRYNAAYTLATHLEAKAPDKTADVLLEALTDVHLVIFNGNNGKVSGVGGEGTAKSEVQEDLGGDARFLAAEALGMLGRKANRPDVVKALEEAARDKDHTLSIKAKEALLAVKRKSAP